jgi:hypothetical protein
MKTLIPKVTKTTKNQKPEAIVNNEAKLLSTFSVGDVSHQGDLMIVGIARLPDSARPRSNRQLADGNTQGSRHVLERGDVFDADALEVLELILEATKCPVAEVYIGPVFISPAEPTPDDLTHPEHGNQGFPAGQVCAVVYQRNLVIEQEAKGARDSRRARERENWVRRREYERRVSD